MEVSKFLIRKKYIIASVLFVALFSMVFMSIYKPFSGTVWFAFSPLPRLLITLSFYIVAISILLASRYLLSLVFSDRSMSVGKYLGWIAGEFVALASLYTLFTVVFDMDGRGITFEHFGRILFCVASILIIPYSIIALYTAYQEKVEEMNLIRFKSVAEQQPVTPDHLIHFYDNNGMLKMSVAEDSLYYIESQDNYVQIYYLLDEKLESYMLRCKTQRLEEALQGTSMVRCHRSYIVNIHKIKHYDNLINRATISLANPSNKQIPVSRSYYRTVTELVSANR